MLDVSGSMNDDGKLRPVATIARRVHRRRCGEQDRFEVMTFNVQPTPLFSSSLRDADAACETAGDASSWPRSRRAAERCCSPAISTAYKYADSRPRR